MFLHSCESCEETLGHNEGTDELLSLKCKRDVYSVHTYNNNIVYSMNVHIKININASKNHGTYINGHIRFNLYFFYRLFSSILMVIFPYLIFFSLFI